MQALDAVVKEGFVRYIGMSSCYAYQFHAMQNYAITHNLTPFISMQNHYNLLYREEEREMMPTLKVKFNLTPRFPNSASRLIISLIRQYFGVGSIPWSPLARGAVTRPHKNTEKTVRAGSDRMSPEAYIADGPGSEAIVDR